MNENFLIQLTEEIVNYSTHRKYVQPGFIALSVNTELFSF